MIRFYNFEQRSPQWYTMREGRWTGSTAIDLMRGKKTPPNNGGDFDNKYMQRGRILEPLAIEAYEKSIGRLSETRHHGFITNSEYKHAGYSPDGVLGSTLLEVKCLNEERHQQLLWSGLPVDIPVEYMAQIQFGLLISGLPEAILIGYNPDHKTPLLAIKVLPDPEVQANMIKRLKETEPKISPAQRRAARRYAENNPDKVRESNRKRYLKSLKKV